MSPLIDEHFTPAADWPKGKKLFIFAISLLMVVNSTLNSSLPSGAANYITAEFHVISQQQKPLLVSVFLIGYITGPIFFAPMSEAWGRKWVMVIPFVFFTAFNIGCALANSWVLLLCFRFVVGVAAAALITVVNGVVADIYTTPLPRGRAFALTMVCTAFGPVLGPIVSNALAPYSWRWTFWFTAIFAGLSWPLLLLLPETYTPVRLARYQRLRQQTLGHDVSNAVAGSPKLAWREILTRRGIRPVLLFSEPVILFSCTFLAVQYGIYYLFFQAYPIIFQEFYGLKPSVAALAFLPLGIGALMAGIFTLWYDGFLMRAEKRGASWAAREEQRRLTFACVGSPLCVIALFWLGWTSQSSISPIVPMLAGAFYGMGFELIFIGLLNYIADCYTTVTASAMASSTFSRSILGVVLPLAATPLYGSLGIHWASTTLAFISLPLATAPFLFLKFGETLRRRSKTCDPVTPRNHAVTHM